LLGLKRNTKNTNKHQPLKGVSVLVVEDEDINYLLVERILAKAGATVVWAKTLSQARNMLNKKAKLDVVLLDINLPDGNGLLFLDEIREHNKSTAIILQSGDIGSIENVDVNALNINGFIIKPIDRVKLLSKIESVI